MWTAAEMLQPSLGRVPGAPVSGKRSRKQGWGKVFLGSHLEKAEKEVGERTGWGSAIFLLLVLLGKHTPVTSQASSPSLQVEAASFRMGGFIRSGATVSPSHAFKLK